MNRTRGLSRAQVRLRSLSAPAAAALAACAVCLHAAFAQGNSVTLIPDPANDCPQCAEWNRPMAPFRVFGNTHYVGTAALSSVLIVSDDGLILLDGAITQSAPLVADSIAQLGFDLADLRLIVTSHTHHDHVGGVAALARTTGAQVAASARAAEALRAGHPNADDPQPDGAFPPVPDVTVVTDGETVHVGGVALTAHMTPGHTPGGTSWTWRSCEDERCLDIVYADSLSAVSADGFRFTETPGRVEEFRASIDAVAALPCDVLLVPHPGVIQLEAKLETWRMAPEENPFIDASSCAAYAEAARAGLERRIAAEAANGD